MKEKKIDVLKANLVGWFTREYPKSLAKLYRQKEIHYKMGYIRKIRDHAAGNYTTTKFCEVTGFTLKTIMNWIEDKKIKAKKVGGKWFIPKTEAERIVIEKRKVNYEESDENLPNVII